MTTKDKTAAPKPDKDKKKKKTKSVDGDSDAVQTAGQENAAVDGKREKADTPPRAGKKRSRDGATADDSPAAKKAKVKTKDVARAQPPAANGAAKGADAPAAKQPGGAAPAANSLDEFPLKDSIKSLLRAKGIESLFDIQARTLQLAIEGRDVVGRARTGCGKTLAFVLPVVEQLCRTPRGGAGHGRKPVAVVLAPTRELAKQVHADFEYIGKAAQLSTLAVYGGTPYATQESALRRGVDIVVGTPGRVKDLLERGTLSLAQLRYRVLDECDEMLSMGFVDDVERILSAGPAANAEGGGGGKDSKAVQTLLFSATLPGWVRDITKRFLEPNFATVDLVVGQKQQASESVRHLLLPCHWSQKTALARDLIRAYGAGGRTIVFCDTKRDCDQLAAELSGVVGARALHGDVAQTQREVVLDAFRRGAFTVLVATDVAARGLDITGVDLVLQIEPPKEVETYIHRSGRTGRAGHSGVCVTLVGRKHEDRVAAIERRAGVKLARIGAPQPADMAAIAAERALESLSDVPEAVRAWFRSAAESALSDGTDAASLLAGALAKLAGFSAVRSRSLINAQEGFNTLRFDAHGSTTLYGPGFVYNFLRRHIEDSTVVEEVKRMVLTVDKRAAVFDVPEEHTQKFLDACAESTAGKLSAATALPELKEYDAPSYHTSPAFGAGAGRGGGSWGGRGRGGGGNGFTRAPFSGSRGRGGRGGRG